MSASPGLKRILVVEDEGDLRGLVTRILEDSGYAVLAAGDGWSAIEALQANRPDLILLDLRLPVLDGWTVLEFARRSVPSPAVALMTVCSDADSIERGLRAGIAGCVFKPFRIRDLVTTCDRILASTDANPIKLTSDVPHPPPRPLHAGWPARGLVLPGAATNVVL